MPWLYQKYVGHDNNRDSYMLTQAESQVVNRLLYREWLPQVMYNQHQGTWPPRIFVPPFPDPVNPNIDPQVMRGVDLVGGAMQDRFEREGKDGVISRYQFSVWYNGSVRTTSYFHNIVGILTETGHASATPYAYNASDFPRHLPNGVSSLAPERDLSAPMEGRHAAPARRDGLHAHRVARGAGGRGEVSRAVPLRHVPGGARQVERAGRKRRWRTSFRPRSTIAGPPRPPRDAQEGGVEVHRAIAPLTADDVEYPAGYARRAALAAVPPVREGPVRGAALSRPAHAPGRPADSALRHGGMDARVPDGCGGDGSVAVSGYLRPHASRQAADRRRPARGRSRDRVGRRHRPERQPVLCRGEPAARGGAPRAAGKGAARRWRRGAASWRVGRVAGCVEHETAASRFRSDR